MVCDGAAASVAVSAAACSAPAVARVGAMTDAAAKITPPRGDAQAFMDKQFITEEDLMLDGFRLGVKVFESGFRPTFIVGLWRGGAPVGIVVQECLQTLGVNTDHIAVRTSNKQGPDGKRVIRVHGTQYLLEKLNADDQLLIVDDACSTGRSVHAVIERLRLRTRRNMPREVRIAVPWYRPAPGPNPPPDFFLYQVEHELVFPYEVSDITDQEIAEHKPFLVPLLAETGPGTPR